MSSEEPVGDIARLAFEHSPMPMVAIDGSGLVVVVNNACELLLARSRLEFLGKPFECLVAAQSAQDFGALWRRLAPGEPDALGRHILQVFLRRDDDQSLSVRLELQCIRAAGTTLVIAGIVDLTEQKQNDARLRAAVESSPNGVLMANQDGLIVLANRECERIFGYAHNELLGSPIELLVPSHMAERHRRDREGYFRDPEARPMGVGRELYGVRKDGTEFPVEVGLTPIAGPEGVTVLASVVDISLRRAMEAKLHEAQRMEAVGALASGIAHDFNNVLLAIHGYAELIQDTPGLPSAVREDIAQVLKGAERGREVVDRMLSVGRRRREVAAPMRLNGPVAEALDLLRASIPKSVEIRRHLDETPAVCCDGTQIHQIVMNLGTNAVKAMAAGGGVLSVSLVPYHAQAGGEPNNPRLQPGLYTRLTVTDDGVGMSSEVQERALEPFFTTRVAGEGTGLGLWLVSEIVQSLQGIIELRSRPGEGSTFDLYFPAASELAIDDGGEEGANAVPHIVYVEDEEALADLGRRRLERAGFRVTTFTSATRALEELKSRIHSFELLVTDNSMPRMSGLELAEELVRLRPSLPVLLVSGLTKFRGEQLPSFVTRALGKPHTAEELIDAVRSLLYPDDT